MRIRRGGPALMGAIGLAVLLSACSAWPFAERLPQVLPSAPLYTGSDAATITVRTTQVGCCYIEGSLRFARLDGPTSREWAVDDGSSRVLDADTYLIGVQRVAVNPGHYTLTAYERVCSGNCDPEFLEDPANQCSLEFDVAAARETIIDVTFPIPDVCSVRLGED
jgi:hypothetical protein